MYLIVICTFVASILAAAKSQGDEVTIQTFVKAEKECLPKFSSVAKDILHDLKITRILPDNPPDDFKCLMDCIGRSIGVIDEAGNFQGEKLKPFYSQALSSVTAEEIHHAIEECAKVDHEIACEKAHLYVICKHDKFKHVDVHDDIKQSTSE